MDKGRWVVRAASLTILLGFFMPSVLVSCSGGLMETSQSFSLADLASQAEQTGLYLLPVCLVVTAVLTFLKEGYGSQLRLYLLGQMAAMAIGLITVIITSISLTNQIQQGTYDLFKVTPDFGAFILAGGFIAFGVGWVMQWQALGSAASPYRAVPANYPDQNYGPPAPVFEPPPLRRSEPYLELISGNLPMRQVPLSGDNFAIGRSADNHLRLPDPSVSRLHALLRFAQGAWYLQDQGSSGGMMVNGANTPATRLSEGDEIEIGPFRFIFHA